MAVKDESIFHPSDNLILPRPRKHYRTSVNPIHWQLRSVIASEDSHIIYYPAKEKIIKLDIHSHEYETIKCLKFEPRCLVAQNKWICCGGEEGDFTAIHLANPVDIHSATPSHPDLSSPSDLEALRLLANPGSPNDDTNGDSIADSPSSLPLDRDTDIPRRLSQLVDAIHQATSDYGTSTPTSGLLAPRQVFGKDRVNCITMWFPPEDMNPHNGAYSKPVAVLSNNDKKVTFVTLNETKSEALDIIKYPDCVNRAVISPDGGLVAAICDDPYLYIHTRTRLPKMSDVYEWELCAKVHLKSQRVEDRSDNRGSFAVCFSNTGRFLAVGTQYGMISIFDTILFLEPGSDPLITVFASSRANSEAGAVRDMAFCPGPFDLLAWSEDRGRIGIADLRRNYFTRQIIHLDKKEGFEHFSLSDKQPIDPRLQEPREGDLASLTSVLNLTSGSPSDRPSGSRRSFNFSRLEDVVRRYNQPLTSEETQVLDALRESNRRRRERDGMTTAEPDGPAPSSSSHYPRPDDPWVARRLATSRIAREILNDYTPYPPSAAPGAQVVPPTATQLRRGVGQARRAATDSSGRASTGNSANPGAASGSGTDLRSRSSIYAQYLADLDPSHVLRLDILASADRLDREREQLFRSQLLQTARAPEPSRGVTHDGETAGLSWSEDGRILFIGADDGIYEFHVNVAGRKVFPSLAMR